MSPSSSSDSTLSSQVYRDVCERIAIGEWLPGAKLTLRKLARELGTSTQPVREALARLASENVLILRPNRSVCLAPLDRKLIDDIFSASVLLEGEAARLCATVTTDEDLLEFESAMRDTRTHYVPDGDLRKRLQAIHRMATLLGEKSGSPFLAQQISSLRLRTAPIYAAAMFQERQQDPEFSVFTVRLQQEFVAALQRRDPTAAADIRRAALYTLQRQMLKLLGIA